MTQSEEVILQMDNKDKEGVVHGFWMVQSIKDVPDRGRNCTRKSPEKDEVEEGQNYPRPAGLASFYALWCSPFTAKSHHEWLHEVRHREEKDVFVNIRRIGKFFAEALGRRVSAGHGGRQPRTEEQHVTPWWDERPKKFLHEIHRRCATSSTAFDKVIRTTAIQAQEIRIRVYHLVKGRRRKAQVHEGKAASKL